MVIAIYCVAMKCNLTISDWNVCDFNSTMQLFAITLLSVDRSSARTHMFQCVSHTRTQCMNRYDARAQACTSLLCHAQARAWTQQISAGLNAAHTQYMVIHNACMSPSSLLLLRLLRLQQEKLYSLLSLMVLSANKPKLHYTASSTCFHRHSFHDCCMRKSVKITLLKCL